MRVSQLRTKGGNILLFGIALLYLAFLFPSHEHPLYNADDGSWFISLALNIVEYGRYTTDTYPLGNYGHHATWPPVFPGLLALLIASFGVNWYVLKLAMVAAGLATLWLLLRLWSPNRHGLWAVLLTSLSPMFFLYSHHVMTEVVYMLVLFATLLALQESVDLKRAFAAGLLGTVAFYTRGYAIALVPAAALFFLMRTEWSITRRFGALCAFVAPMLIGVLIWKGYTEHVVANYPLDWITSRFGTGSALLEQALRSPLEHVKALWWHDGRYPVHLLLPVFSLNETLRNDWLAMLSIILFLLAFSGWLSCVRTKIGILEIWLPIAMALQVLPGNSGIRYWLTFLPFLAFYVAVGIFRLAKLHPGLSRLAPVVLGILVLSNAAALAGHIIAPAHLRFVTPEAVDYRDAALWARDHLPAESLIAVDRPHWFYAVSQRSAVSPANSHSASHRPKYVVCAPAGGPSSSCDALLRNGSFELIHGQGSLSLYRSVAENP